jgi:anaerobic selenocysteine-containing dehydrogenase
MGFIPSTDAIVLQLYCEPLAAFRQAGRGFGEPPAPAAHRARLQTYFDPLPIWYPPFEEAQVDTAEFPLHAITQRPMAMYHSWGSQNAWLRQIYGANKLYVHRDTAAKLGIADDDWVDVTSHNGQITVQVKTMTGCNPDTVWTWNAIGKRRGAWNLSADVAESNQGFLLNHLISDLLPEAGRYGNSDPVTGQAAWFDLRVRVARAEAPPRHRSQPAFPTLPQPPGVQRRPNLLRYGQRFLPKGNWRRRKDS